MGKICTRGALIRQELKWTSLTNQAAKKHFRRAVAKALKRSTSSQNGNILVTECAAWKQTYCHAKENSVTSKCRVRKNVNCVRICTKPLKKTIDACAKIKRQKLNSYMKRSWWFNRLTPDARKREKEAMRRFVGGWKLCKKKYQKRLIWLERRLKLNSRRLKENKDCGSRNGKGKGTGKGKKKQCYKEIRRIKGRIKKIKRHMKRRCTEKRYRKRWQRKQNQKKRKFRRKLLSDIPKPCQNKERICLKNACRAPWGDLACSELAMTF